MSEAPKNRSQRRAAGLVRRRRSPKIRFHSRCRRVYRRPCIGCGIRGIPSYQEKCWVCRNADQQFDALRLRLQPGPEGTHPDTTLPRL